MIRNISILLIFWACTVGLQWKNGAYGSDFGAHADEPAHVVTGLMLRDYLAGPLWRGVSPIAFAKGYYEKFPKVALGHYPPLFYVAEGLALLPLRSRLGVLVFSALITAAAAWLIVWLGVRLTTWHQAIAAGLAFCLYRAVQTYTSIVMSDLMVVALCLLSVWAWSRFLETRHPRWSLAFGGLAAATILTKGSGLLLAFVPPLTLLMRGDWMLLGNWRLWLAVPPVALFALPWMVATAHITAEGMADQSTVDYLREALPYYLGQSVQFIGPVALLLLAASAVHWFQARKSGQSPHALETCLWALLMSVYLLCVLIPSGLDSRYLLPALPAALLLAMISALRLIEPLLAARGWNGHAWSWGFAAFALLLLIAGRHEAPRKQITGPSQLINQLDSGNLLVCSDAHGEGALIVAAALQAPHKNIKVLRGSKVLSTSDWMGRGYKIAFETKSELARIFEKSGVDYVVLDELVTGTRKTEHQIRLEGWTRSLADDLLTPVAEIPAYRRSQSGKLLLFRVRGPSG